ncbi:dsba-like thioredoxin domain [Trichoderma arundinaceum]|uniref:Dsba-like thioredoxin domain n=1 Tax=Trichoderma arundinaceum TaxID=490622 RepID=A0A395NF30_TRIAR|nr:dsba-like thioredoxin domain [Trichoderma arundinaceum]
MSASPLIGVPSQQHQHYHNGEHHQPPQQQQQQQRQPLPSAGRRPTAAAMRREKMAGLATGGRGAGGLIRLEVYVDMLCPWCFIEKHSLESLMQRYTEEHPEVRFEVTYKPYYIAPTMPKRESLFFFVPNVAASLCVSEFRYMGCGFILAASLIKHIPAFVIATYKSHTCRPNHHHHPHSAPHPNHRHRRHRHMHPIRPFTINLESQKQKKLTSTLPGGVEKRTISERLERRTPNFLNRIQVTGAKYDIAFSIRGVTGNTRSAHRLIAAALQELGPAGQSHVVEQIFQGHFEDGRDLSDEAWLVAVGVAAGMPEAAARLALEDDEAGRRVDALAEAARSQFGVEAVPCVMVQGRYKVGGYQEGHVFESLFEKIRLAGEAF